MAERSEAGREPLVGVGLKMFLGYAESLRYLGDVADAAPAFAGVGVFVLPSFPVIAEAASALRGTAVAYGAQDGHWQQEGAFTGCVSPSMLRELGCTFMEVGHAERRRLFGEDDAMTARKAAAAVQAGLVPIICVGEQHAGDDAAVHAVAQAAAVLAELPADAAAVIAYEPIWAIGAEAPADERHIALVATALRASTSSRPGGVRLLYGGSVAAGRAGEIMRAGLDGVFVGRGALEIEGLRGIVDEVRAAA
jgi:L-erythrulose 1-phosphate isomerase